MHRQHALLLLLVFLSLLSLLAATTTVVTDSIVNSGGGAGSLFHWCWTELHAGIKLKCHLSIQGIKVFTFSDWLQKTLISKSSVFLRKLTYCTLYTRCTSALKSFCHTSGKCTFESRAGHRKKLNNLRRCSSVSGVTDALEPAISYATNAALPQFTQVTWIHLLALGLP